jgi:hypothetical protein
MYVGVDLSHGPSDSNRRRLTVAVVTSVDDIIIWYFREISIFLVNGFIKEYWKSMKYFELSVICTDWNSVAISFT